MNVNGRPQLDTSDPNAVNGDSDEYKIMTKIIRGKGIEVQLANPLLNEVDRIHYSATTIINLHDVLRGRYGYHPVTFGDVYMDDNGITQPKETVLTAKNDWKALASLDYIFLIDEKVDEVATHPRVKIDIQKTKIEEFLIKDELFTQLSGEYIS